MPDDRPKVLIENWMVMKSWWGGPNTILCGEVHGHPNFGDGKFVYTSAVTELDTSSKKAVTLNTDYVLGDPDSKWVDALKKSDESFQLSSVDIQPKQ
jgi:hypothetical protein